MSSGNAPIGNDERVRRGAKGRHLAWDQKGRSVVPVHEMFFLREPLGEDALSVDRTHLRQVAQAFRQWPPNMWAAYILCVDAIRDMELDVEARPSQENVAHAGITGLPQHWKGLSEFNDAMFFATRLLALATFEAFRDDNVPVRVMQRHGKHR